MFIDKKTNRYTGMTNNPDYHKRMVLPTPNFKRKQSTYNPGDFWGVNQVHVINALHLLIQSVHVERYSMQPGEEN